MWWYLSACSPALHFRRLRIQPEKCGGPAKILGLLLLDVQILAQVAQNRCPIGCKTEVTKVYENSCRPSRRTRLVSVPIPPARRRWANDGTAGRSLSVSPVPALSRYEF